MRPHLLIPLVGRLLFTTVAAMPKFRQVQTQFIAADPGMTNAGASSGTGASQWGIWRVDPGPRGVRLEQYARLEGNNGVAPAGWKFDDKDWWLEEHGLIMEKPDFPLAAGRYLVTGGREVTTVLTIHPKGDDGSQQWELADGAKLHDV